MSNPVAPPPPAGGAVPPPPQPAQEGFGSAPQPPQEGFGAAPQPAAKPPSKVRGLVKRVIGLVVAFAVFGAIGLAYRTLTGDPSTADVGDCLNSTASADDMKTVECGDAAAAYKVVGKVDGVKESDFTPTSTSCSAYPTAEGEFWMGKRGSTGAVLCLEPVKK